MLAIKIIIFSGIPILIKSVNLYPPGPYIWVLIVEPNGVAKDALIEINTDIQKVIGFASSAIAVCMAIGVNTAAHNSFPINSLTNVAIDAMIMRAVNGESALT